MDASPLGALNPSALLTQLQHVLTQSTERAAEVAAQQTQAATQQAAMTAAIEHLATAIEALVVVLRPPSDATARRRYVPDLASRTD